MHVIQVPNVNHAYRKGIDWLIRQGKRQIVRGGKECLVSPVPVTTVYTHPRERVLFESRRRANPFFHFFEALWILAGRQDVAYLAQFNKNIKNFSDDGNIFHGAYGYRLRFHHMFDQFEYVIELFRNAPQTRRAVLQIWDAPHDLAGGEACSADIPCNDIIFLDQKEPGKLDMTVCCRSNDIVWGCYGANVVQFSTILEYLASMLGMEVGWYYQISNNFHLYTGDGALGNGAPDLTVDQNVPDFYAQGLVEPYPIVADPATFDSDLRLFMDNPHACTDCRNRYFSSVALPMLETWEDRKDPDKALRSAQYIEAEDWRQAAIMWIRTSKAFIKEIS